jgi:hypothetical protein
MYQLEAGTNKTDYEALSSELNLPYGLTVEEYMQLPGSLRVAVALKGERMQQTFKDADTLMANLAEETNLQRDELIAANKQLVQPHNGDKYAELIRSDDGLRFVLHPYGQDFLEAGISRLRYGSAED